MFIYWGQINFFLHPAKLSGSRQIAVLRAICYYTIAVHDKWCYNRRTCFMLKYEVKSVKKVKNMSTDNHYWHFIWQLLTATLPKLRTISDCTWPRLSKYTYTESNFTTSVELNFHPNFLHLCLPYQVSIRAF